MPLRDVAFAVKLHKFQISAHFCGHGRVEESLSVSHFGTLGGGPQPYYKDMSFSAGEVVPMLAKAHSDLFFY